MCISIFILLNISDENVENLNTFICQLQLLVDFQITDLYKLILIVTIMHCLKCKKSVWLRPVSFDSDVFPL